MSDMSNCLRTIVLILSNVAFGDRTVRITITRKDCGVYYCGNLSIGNPRHQFRMLFDTGSCYTWVPSVRSRHLNREHGYNKYQSTTFKNMGDLFAVEYASCHITGHWISDDFRLSGELFPHIHFGLAQKSFTEACATRPFDGIIGMCQAAASLNGELTLLNQLVHGGLVDKLMFSVWIDPEPSYSNGGLVIIGGVDSRLYTGPLLYVKTTSDMFWQVKMTGIRINNGNLLARGSVAVIDSGGDGVWLPADMIRLINDRFSKSIRLNAANEAVHCDNVSNLPVLHFLIGRISVSLGPEYYTDRMTTNGHEVCRLLLKESIHELAGYTVLGIPLLRKFYTVFDKRHHQIGFARSVPFPNS